MISLSHLDPKFRPVSKEISQNAQAKAGKPTSTPRSKEGITYTQTHPRQESRHVPDSVHQSCQVYQGTF